MQKQTTAGIIIALVASAVCISGGMGILLADKNTKFNSLLADYNQLNQEHQLLLQDYDKLTAAQKAIAGKASAENTVAESVPAEKTANSFIQRYYGMKYPVASGVRRYVGEEPLRIYPNSKAPFIYENYKPDVVELINEIQVVPPPEAGFTEPEMWCLVLDSRGVSGYAPSADLIALAPEEGSVDHGSGKETLGGFQTGDRIETLIGQLDRDYYLIYENGRIYTFPDDPEQVNKINPIERPFSGMLTLDTFVRDTNKIVRLRTDSPKFPLKDGYKVGDNAMKVLAFYESKYKYLDDPDQANSSSQYTFVLEEGHRLEFQIDTAELNENSVISSIIID